MVLMMNNLVTDQFLYPILYILKILYSIGSKVPIHNIPISSLDDKSETSTQFLGRLLASCTKRRRGSKKEKEAGGREGK